MNMEQAHCHKCGRPLPGLVGGEGWAVCIECAKGIPTTRERLAAAAETERKLAIAVETLRRLADEENVSRAIASVSRFGSAGAGIAYGEVQKYAAETLAKIGVTLK